MEEDWDTGIDNSAAVAAYQKERKESHRKFGTAPKVKGPVHGGPPLCDLDNEYYSDDDDMWRHNEPKTKQLSSHKVETEDKSKTQGKQHVSNKAEMKQQSVTRFGRGRGIMVISDAHSQPEIGTNANSKIKTSSIMDHEETKSEQMKAEVGETLDDSMFAATCDANPSISRTWLQKVLKSDNDNNDDHSVPLGSKSVDSHCLTEVKNAWSRDSVTTEKVLNDCFSTVQNPYSTALYLTEKADDYYSGKTNTLSFYIMKCFEKWTKRKHTHLDKDKFVNKKLRLHAFKIGTHGSMCLLDLISSAFHLNHEGNDYFLPHVIFFLENKKYKEAANCVSKLGLQNHFDIKDIVLPLLLQDKVNLVEMYVYRNQQQQHALLKLLDWLVDRDTCVSTLILESEVPNIQRDKMTTKILGKLAVRLMKLYQVPQDVCPNVTKERSMKGLRYLLYKKYIEETVAVDQWDELIKTILGEDTYLQLQLVDNIVGYCDMTEAARWARYYKLPREHLPEQVISLLTEENSQDSDEKEEEEDWNSEVTSSHDMPYHTLSLPREAVHWIDNKEGYLKSLQHLAETGGPVGLDAEWRPSFGSNILNNKVALLQLACSECVYLWDMLELYNCLTPDDWQALSQKLLLNDKIIKLGYGIEGDLQMLAKVIPQLKQSLQQMHRVVELQKLHHQINKQFKEFFKCNREQSSDGGKVSLSAAKEERGLADLVQLILGRRLDKSQQLSDWQRRPLRIKQIIYAALDAFCLTEVYNTIKMKAQEHNLDLDLEPVGGHTAKLRKTRLERHQQRVAERQSTTLEKMVHRQPKIERTGPVITPGELRVVVDNMLQGLGKQLRCCGVDVVMLGNDDDHDLAAKIAMKENRCILTSGSPYDCLRSYVGEGRCMNVLPMKASEQLEDVLDYFNVVVSQNDLFSRCQVCNGNQYLFVSPAEMKEITKIKKSRTLMQQAAAENLAKERLGSGSLSNQRIQEYRGADRASTQYDHIDMETLCLPNGTPVMCEVIHDTIFTKVDTFYVCSTCGKVYWEGSHWDRVCEQFSRVVKVPKTD